MLIKNKKLPLNLVKDAFHKTTSKGERLLQIESYSDTFGPMSRRKRPNIGTSNLSELLMSAAEGIDEYNVDKDADLTKFDILDSKQ